MDDSKASKVGSEDCCKIGFNASFNALSKPVPPLLLSLSRLVVVYIPAAIAAGHYYGYLGVYAVTTAVTVLFGILGWRWNARTISRLRPLT